MTKPLGRFQGATSERVVDDLVEKKTHIIKTQDVEGIIQANHELSGLLKSTKGNSQSSMKRVGTIPVIVGLKWAQESGLTMYSRPWYDYCRKKLKDPENRGFRVEAP